MLVRVSKLLAQRGWCSRREADEYIRQGLVAVNGEILSTLGTKVDMNTAHVELLPQAMTQQTDKVTIVLNKPLGMVSSQPDINSRYDPAVQLLMRENYWWQGTRGDLNAAPRYLAPRFISKLGVCGRLDVNSSGLLLFTQDGVLAKHVIQAHSKIEKEYLVRVSTLLLPPLKGNRQRSDLRPSRPISAILDQLHEGIWCDGTGILNPHRDGDRKIENPRLRGREPDFLTAKSIEIVNENQLRFILTEGKQRHIRRMCAKVGLDVVALKRVRIGQLALGSLPLGKWRYVDPRTDVI